MTWLLVLLIIVAVIYVLGWAIAATVLILHDPNNKWLYLIVALMWPMYIVDALEFRAWK